MFKILVSAAALLLLAAWFAPAGAQQTECDETPPTHSPAAPRTESHDQSGDGYCHGNVTNHSGLCSWNHQGVTSSVDCVSMPSGKRCFVFLNCADSYPNINNSQKLICTADTAEATAGTVGSGANQGKGFVHCGRSGQPDVNQTCTNPPNHNYW